MRKLLYLISTLLLTGIGGFNTVALAQDNQTQGDQERYIQFSIIDDDGRVVLMTQRPLSELAPAEAFTAAEATDVNANFFDLIPVPKEVACPVACGPRAGYGACVIRCVATGQVCDAGAENCSGL